jgi:hypothetical protein
MRCCDAKREGQVSLEIGFAMMAAFVLIMGSVALFGWLNSRLVYREEAFETDPITGRVAAGAVWGKEIQVDEGSVQDELNIFAW